MNMNGEDKENILNMLYCESQPAGWYGLQHTASRWWSAAGLLVVGGLLLWPAFQCSELSLGVGDEGKPCGHRSSQEERHHRQGCGKCLRVPVAYIAHTLEHHQGPVTTITEHNCIRPMMRRSTSLQLDMLLLLTHDSIHLCYSPSLLQFQRTYSPLLPKFAFWCNRRPVEGPPWSVPAHPAQAGSLPQGQAACPWQCYQQLRCGWRCCTCLPVARGGCCPGQDGQPRCDATLLVGKHC
jgi:hypothetical protein